MNILYRKYLMIIVLIDFLMTKFFPECPEYIQNYSILSDCLVADLRNNTFCCLKDCCFLNRRPRDIWQTWYFWTLIIILVLLIFSTFLSYIAGLFKKKHHNLIRVRHQSARQNPSQPIVAAISGSDGIIQPNIHYNIYSKMHKKNMQFQNGMNNNTNAENIQCSMNSERHPISPLSPPYTPIKPVTIIRGSAPPMGYRQTSTYTELVLPPGYIQARNNGSLKSQH